MTSALYFSRFRVIAKPVATRLFSRKAKLPLLTFFTKDECSLCDDALEVLEPHRDKFDLEFVDITEEGNEEWFDKYRYDIPVIHLNGQPLMKHRVFEQAFLEALANANSRGS